MKPDNKTWEERFDKRFECDLTQDGISKWIISTELLDGQIMTYRARKEDFKGFIRQELATQKKQMEEERSQAIKDTIEDVLNNPEEYKD